DLGSPPMEARTEARKGLNPNEERREGLIRLIGRWTGVRRSRAARTDLVTDGTELRARYQASGQVWYAGLLGVLIASAGGEKVRPEDAVPLFPGAATSTDLANSFLF